MKKRQLTESEKMLKLNRFLNESELSPEQEKEMDLDDDGDIDADDLANLRAGKKELDEDMAGDAVMVAKAMAKIERDKKAMSALVNMSKTGDEDAFKSEAKRVLTPKEYTLVMGMLGEGTELGSDHEEPDGDEDEFGNEPLDHDEEAEEIDEIAVRPNAKKGDHKQGIQLLDKLNASGIDLNDAIAKLDAWVYKSDPKVMPKENVKLVKDLRNEWFKLQRTIRSTISNMNLQFQGDTDEKSGFRNESTTHLKDMIKEMVKEIMEED